MGACLSCKVSAERETQEADYWVRRRSFGRSIGVHRKKYYCEYHLERTNFPENDLWEVRLIEPEQTDLLQP